MPCGPKLARFVAASSVNGLIEVAGWVAAAKSMFASLSVQANGLSPKSGKMSFTKIRDRLGVVDIGQRLRGHRLLERGGDHAMTLTLHLSEGRRGLACTCCDGRSLTSIKVGLMLVRTGAGFAAARAAF